MKPNLQSFIDWAHTNCPFAFKYVFVENQIPSPTNEKWIIPPGGEASFGVLELCLKTKNALDQLLTFQKEVTEQKDMNSSWFMTRASKLLHDNNRELKRTNQQYFILYAKVIHNVEINTEEVELLKIRFAAYETMFDKQGKFNIEQQRENKV